MKSIKAIAFLSALMMLTACSSQSADVSSQKSTISKEVLSSDAKSTLNSTATSTQTSEQSSAVLSKETSSKYPNKADFNALQDMKNTVATVVLLAICVQLATKTTIITMIQWPFSEAFML